MNLLENHFNNNSVITETGNLSDTEKNLYDDLLTPLKEYDTDEPIEEPEIENSDDQNNQTEQTEENTSEQKKRFQRLNSLGAKGIVKAVDIGNANLCSWLACNNDATIYRAEPEAINDLIEVVSEAIPKKVGENLKIPIWAQILIYTLIAFLPVVFAALSDRRKNKEIAQQKKEIRKLKQQMRLMQMQKQVSQMQEDFNQNNNQENIETKN